MTPATTRAIVFDVGGVLSGPPFEPLERYGATLGLPTGALTAYFIDDPEFMKVERGQLDVRSFFVGMRERVIEAHGVDLDLRAVAKTMHEARTMRPEMLAMARELARHHTIGVLSNNTRENIEFLREQLPLDVVDPLVNSAEAGARKPDPAAYAYLLDQLGRPGDEVIYVDDFPVNLPPAQDLGMHTILFESVEQCRADLIAAGAILEPDPTQA